MISYANEEIFPANHAAQHFGDILRRLKERTISRAAVSENNAIEAVILPVEEYEKFYEIAEWLELKEIDEIVQERKDSKKTHSLADVLRDIGINYNEI